MEATSKGGLRSKTEFAAKKTGTLGVLTGSRGNKGEGMGKGVGVDEEWDRGVGDF